jgi:hypothetical protein
MTGKNYSANNTGKRKASDFYETPYHMTRMLLEQETLVGSILEPACGNNAMVKIIQEQYADITAYDVEKDFFTETSSYDTIITNPPFSLAYEFITHAKTVATTKICFLLPLNYLHGVKRYRNIWKDETFPLEKIYVFTRYPLLGQPLREDGKVNTGMMVYAWYIWSKSYKGKPTINWLDNNSFILSNKKLRQQKEQK